MEENKKVILSFVAVVYLVSLYISSSFYDSDIRKYNDALSGKIHLYPPTEFEEKKWDVELYKLQAIEAKLKYDLEKAQLEKRKDADWLEFQYNKMGEKILDHHLNMPVGHNPPKQRLEFLIKDASSKNTSLFVGTMIVGGSLLGVVMGLFAFRNKQ